MQPKSRLLSLGFLALTILSAACGQAEPEIYRPPTLVPQLAPPPQPSDTPAPTLAAPLLPTAPALLACADNLTFLEDLTIPDGTQVEPNQALDKRWRVQNSGTCNWNESYRIRLISGPDLGAPTEQALYPARAGAEFTIQVAFSAPAEPGTYQSAWQAVDPQGTPFGDPVFIQVIVAAP